MKEKLVKDSGVADERAYDEIVQKLLTKPRARGELLVSLLNLQKHYLRFIVFVRNVKKYRLNLMSDACKKYI